MESWYIRVINSFNNSPGVRISTKNRYFNGVLGLLALGSYIAYCLIDNKPVESSFISASGLLEAIFIVSSGIFVFRKYHRTEFYNVEALLGSLVFSGLLVYFISVLPDLLYDFGYNFLSTERPASIYLPFSKLLVFIFFLFSSMMFYRLAFAQNGNKKKYYLRAVLMIIAISLLLQVFPELQSNLMVKSFFALSGTMIFFLVIKLDWIALLSLRSKILTILILSLLCLILLGITQTLWFRQPYRFTVWNISHNIPLSIFILFADAYALVSFLSLLFNLPIASFIDKKNAEIESFMRINRSISAHAETTHILRTLFKTSMENTNADSGWVLLLQDDREEQIIEFEIISEKNIARLQSSLKSKQRLQLNAGNRYLYIKDIRQDPNLRNHDIEERSLIEFPVRVKETLRGKLFLLKRIVSGFDEYQINLVESFIAQASVSMQNIDLLHDALKAERLKEDLEIGKNVQKRLLPDSFPYINKIDMAAESEAAQQVGGDYYDFYRIDENKMGLLIGDVSGKGTAAAFHVAKMKGIFQSLMLESYAPARFIEKANAAVSQSFDKGMFITLTYLEVDLLKQQIKYSRGGHCPLLVYRAASQQAEYLEDEGLGLGILRNGSFAKTICEKTLSYRKGDAFCLYTDGLTEARHALNEEEFGYKRLQQYLQDYGKLEAKEIVKRLMNRVKEFTGPDNQLDDISILIFKPA